MFKRVQKKRRNRTGPHLGPLYFTLCSLPFLVLLWTVAVYGVNVPFNDELYGLAPLMEKVFLTGDWTLSDFYGQLNDHRPVVPVLLLTAAAWITNWNAHAELFLAPVLAALNVILICRISIVTAPKLPLHTRGFFMLLTCILTFSITQWENWSQGINIAFLFPITFLLAGLFILSRGEGTWQRVSIAAGCCFLASFSHAEGLLTWFALLPLIERKHSPLWLFLTAVALLSYFWGFEPMPRSLLSTASAFSRPWHMSLYAVRVLGTPFFPLASPASALTGIGLLLFAAGVLHTMTKSQRVQALPWICLLLYAVLFACVLAVGRGSLTGALGEEISSRVFSSSLLASLAVIPLALCSRGEKGWSPLFLSFLIVLVGVTTTLGSMRSLPYWKERSVTLREGKECIEQKEPPDDACLRHLFKGEHLSMVRGAARSYQEIRRARLQ